MKLTNWKGEGILFFSSEGEERVSSAAELEYLVDGDKDRDKEESLCGEFVSVSHVGLLRSTWKCWVSLNLGARCRLIIEVSFYKEVIMENV